MSAGAGDMGEAVLRLVIKGLSPADAQHFATQTFGGLESAMQASIARQVEAHRKAAEATTKEAQKAAAAEVKASKDATKAIATAMKDMESVAKKAADQQIKEAKKVADAQVAAAKEAESAQRKLFRAQEELAKSQSAANAGALQALANITIIGKGAIGAITGAYAQFKALGEEIIRTSQIFGSLRGSIDGAREATQGTVTDMDLISAKNRALEMDLKLTDKQFATVAATADNFADAIGTDGTEAMNKLIQALATGQDRLLKRAGIMIDVTKAEKAFAESIGKSVENLTDEEKRHGFQVAALEKMDTKLRDSGGNVVTFGNLLEKTFVAVRNAWDRTMAGIGNIEVGSNSGAYVRGEARRGSAAAARVAREKADHDARTASLNALGAVDDSGELVDPEAGMVGSYGVDADGKVIDTGTGGQGVPSNYYAGRNAGITTKRLGKPGKKVPLESTSELSRSFGGDVVAMIAARQQAKDYEEIRKITEEADASTEDGALFGFSSKGEASLADDLARFDERQKALREQAAPLGVLGLILFGPDGPDQLYAEMDEVGQVGMDAVDMMSDTGKAMAGALSESYVAWAAGEKGFRAALKESTREVLRNLAIRAAEYGAMKAAEAAGALAEENYVGAAKLAAASAGFFALAGGIAYASGQLASTPAGAKPTVSRTPKFTTAPTTGGERSTGNVNMTINVAPGGEEAAGRSILDALLALKAQTGIDISKRLSNG